MFDITYLICTFVFCFQSNFGLKIYFSFPRSVSLHDTTFDTFLFFELKNSLKLWLVSIVIFWIFIQIDILWYYILKHISYLTIRNSITIYVTPTDIHFRVIYVVMCLIAKPYKKFPAEIGHHVTLFSNFNKRVKNNKIL